MPFHERICVARLLLFTRQMSSTRSAVGIHACHLLSDLSRTVPSFAQIADETFRAASPQQISENIINRIPYTIQQYMPR